LEAGGWSLDVQCSIFLKFYYPARTIADCLICFANRDCRLPIGLRLDQIFSPSFPAEAISASEGKVFFEFRVQSSEFNFIEILLSCKNYCQLFDLLCKSGLPIAYWAAS